MTKAKMTLRTDNEGERAANLSVDIELTTRDNDNTVCDDETMIVLNGNDLTNANAMELEQF